MTGTACANLPVCWVFHMTVCISNFGIRHSLYTGKVFFYAPKATAGQNDFLHLLLVPFHIESSFASHITPYQEH
jgi:hypothetical protein